MQRVLHGGRIVTPQPIEKAADDQAVLIGFARFDLITDEAPFSSIAQSRHS